MLRDVITHLTNRNRMQPETLPKCPIDITRALAQNADVAAGTCAGASTWTCHVASEYSTAVTTVHGGPHETEKSLEFTHRMWACVVSYTLARRVSRGVYGDCVSIPLVKSKMSDAT